MKPVSALKITILFTALFSLSQDTFAQYSKWVVQFTDKKNSPYALSEPSEYLSARAIKRRNLHNVTIDSTDLPVNPNYILQVLAQGPSTYLSQSKWLNQILINCTSAATLNAINALPFVKGVNPVKNLTGKGGGNIDKFKETVEPVTFSAKTKKTNTVYDYGYSYEQVHIHNGEFLHQKGFSGKGVIIAIIDAGFYHYRTIRAFDSARAHNQFLGERDFVTFDNSVNEDDTHGENCLSIICANVPGVMVGTAPKASFWLLRGETTLSEYPVEEHNWVAAAEFADSAGADMISSSLGYFTFDDPALNHTYNDFYKNTTMVTRGAAYAAKKGLIVTNSAGNEGYSSWNYIIFPADADSVCAVGATDANGNIAYFSSFGYPGKVKPNIASVGSGTIIYTTYGVSAGSGTSFSNPNINGLIACLWQAFPRYNNMTILKAVYASSSKARHPDDRFGYGLPDMKLAYHILKAKQNSELYGNEWLFANADEKSSKIAVRLIGQADGEATLILADESGRTISQIRLTTEQDEVYENAFNGWSELPAGKYSVVYKDAAKTRSIAIIKEAANNEWLHAQPVPFARQLTIHLTAPETGKAALKLTDAAGNVLQNKQITVSLNRKYTYSFDVAATLPQGIYYVQYEGLKERKTIAVTKK